MANEPIIWEHRNLIENFEYKRSVNFNNRFNTVPLRNFNATELNILMYLCSKLKRQRDKIIDISFEDIKTLTKYGSKDKERFIEDLQSTNRKLLDCKFSYETEEDLIDLVLFTTFKISKSQGKLTVRVNDDFLFLLNDFTEQFTRFELNEFVDLKSSYTKECYRRLKQFSDTGHWYVSIDRFRYELDIPDSYRMYDIDRRVLKPINEELSELFDYFKIIKKKKGNKVIGLQFDFTRENREKKNKLDEDEIIESYFDMQQELETHPSGNFYLEHKDEIEENRKKFLKLLEDKSE